MWASALLLLACASPQEQEPAAAPAEPPLIAPEPLLPAPQHTLAVTRLPYGLAVDGRPCPGSPTWTAGDLAVVCIDPAALDADGARALLAEAPGAAQLAVYPAPELPWPLWFFGAELTLLPSDAPLRDESGGALRLGVADALTVERVEGWTRAGGGWIRDDLPLGSSLLLRPRGAEADTFELRHPEIVWKLAAEVADGEGEALLNGGSLTDAPPIPLGEGYTLHNPPVSLLRRGENRVSGERDVGLSGHIGEEVALDWRAVGCEPGWQELRSRPEAPGERCRRARLEAPAAHVGAQVWLDGPGRVWLNGAEILALEQAGRGQVPPGAWLPGDNLLAVEAGAEVRASLRRY